LPPRGTNAVPIAFDPNTGLIYASTWNVPRIQQLAPRKPIPIGGASTGVIARNRKSSQGCPRHFAAINPLTGREEVGDPVGPICPSSAGMLATGGGAGVHWQLSGEFIALDENTGETLWQFKTKLELNSTAITYTHKGRQM